MESDSSEELVRALSICRVPEALSTQIVQAYETPSDFAFAFPQLPDLNRLLEEIDEDTKRAIGLEPDANILASLPASRLRKAFKMCQDATMHGGTGTQPQLTPTPVRSLDGLTHSHEWVENLPPKLTMRRWTALYPPSNKITRVSFWTTTPCPLFAYSALYTKD